MGVMHRAGRVCMAAAGETKSLAMRLAQDRGTGIEHPGHDRRVQVGRIAFQRRGAVHHRHASQADIVLEHDGLAGERAGPRALNLGLHVPGVELVLLRQWLVAGCARISHARLLVRQRVDQPVGGDGAHP